MDTVTFIPHTNGFNDENFFSCTEITHGFDDKGRQFDLVGNMKQWWNNATIKNFRERAQCIIDQYSRYRIDEVGLFMNGRMTQGENIAVRFKIFVVVKEGLNNHKFPNRTMVD